MIPETLQRGKRLLPSPWRWINLTARPLHLATRWDIVHLATRSDIGTVSVREFENARTKIQDWQTSIIHNYCWNINWHFCKGFHQNTSFVTTYFNWYDSHRLSQQQNSFVLLIKVLHIFYIMWSLARVMTYVQKNCIGCCRYCSAIWLTNHANFKEKRH